jgi:hypothetical protein
MVHLDKSHSSRCPAGTRHTLRQPGPALISGRARSVQGKAMSDSSGFGVGAGVRQATEIKIKIMIMRNG